MPRQPYLLSLLIWLSLPDCFSTNNLEDAYGFFMVYDQIIHNGPNNLQNMASRFSDYLQTPNASFADDYRYTIFALMKEGCHGTVAPGNSSGDIEVLMQYLVKTTFRLIADASAFFVFSLIPTLSDCLPELACSLATPTNTSYPRWELFIDSYLWYSTTCADANPILAKCLCESRNVLIDQYNASYYIGSLDVPEITNATFPHALNILQQCAYYTYIL